MIRSVWHLARHSSLAKKGSQRATEMISILDPFPIKTVPSSLNGHDNFTEAHRSDISRSDIQACQSDNVPIESMHEKADCSSLGKLANYTDYGENKLSFYEGQLQSQNSLAKPGRNEPATSDSTKQKTPFMTEISPLLETNPDKLTLDSRVEVSRAKHGIVPEGLEYYLLSPEEKKQNIGMGKRLNDLYNRIMRFSEDGETSIPKNSEELTQQFRKGILMPTDQENDEFSRLNKLSIDKTKFDRIYSYWKGKSRIDNVPEADFEQMQKEKSSLLAYHIPEYTIPKLRVDPCPGCGAIFQDENEADFGFITHEMIHKWIVRYGCIVKNRTEYSERRYRLFCHWATEGKKYGEEWLDFMTQEEFNAFYIDKLKPAVCTRCLALQNFRTSTEDTIMSAPDFYTQLQALRDEKGLFILVVDLFDFNGSMIRDLQRLVTMNNPVLLVANKLDKVQKHRNEFKHAEAQAARQSHGFYRSWIHDQLRAFGFPVHHLKDIFIVSATRGWYMSELADKIEKLTNLTYSHTGRPQNAYLIGCTNVGKSSIINCLAKHFSKRAPPHPEAYREYHTVVKPDGTSCVQWEWKMPQHKSPADLPHTRSGISGVLTNKIITASPIPGTTIRMIGIPLTSEKNSVVLFDTPGIIPEWQQKTVLNLREQAQCASPQSRFMPKYYKMAEGFTIFISGLICIDILKCHPSGLLLGLYLSPNVTHVRCPTDRSEEMWRQHVGTLLKPPYDPNTVADGLTKKRKYFFECEKNVKEPKADIYFNGIGWVTLYSTTYDVVVRVRTHSSLVHGVRSPLSNKELHRRRARLIKKKSGKLNEERTMSPIVQYWPSPRACVTCHSNFSLQAVEPKLIQLVDEPIAEPSADVEPNEKGQLLHEKPNIDEKKLPWEDIMEQLKDSGRLVDQ
ncbi:hypothetical protein XU18_1046 [Perkinsela sp. CCAP 1560/4]|nr:hypothetical protein XU18_1046 [Perkinsela sp. CCAP 1560/4]|eukprot:KNH08477.1 hypothetical protein XU18_1046 [Perkinsela sp. CCAP 1560/4]